MDKKNRKKTLYTVVFLISSAAPPFRCLNLKRRRLKRDIITVFVFFKFSFFFFYIRAGVRYCILISKRNYHNYFVYGSGGGGGSVLKILKNKKYLTKFTRERTHKFNTKRFLCRILNVFVATIYVNIKRAQTRAVSGKDNWKSTSIKIKHCNLSGRYEKIRILNYNRLLVLICFFFFFYLK